MQAVFSSAPLGFDEWWRILLFSAFSFGVVEVEKWLTSRRRPARDLLPNTVS